MQNCSQHAHSLQTCNLVHTIVRTINFRIQLFNTISLFTQYVCCSFLHAVWTVNLSMFAHSRNNNLCLILLLLLLHVYAFRSLNRLTLHSLRACKLRAQLVQLRAVRAQSVAHCTDLREQVGNLRKLCTLLLNILLCSAAIFADSINDRVEMEQRKVGGDLIKM